jgi:hypothetical protein
MTTAPITEADVLDFEITDPGTPRTRPARLRVVKPVCASCQPDGSTRAVAVGDEVYETCIVCATEPSAP